MLTSNIDVGSEQGLGYFKIINHFIIDTTVLRICWSTLLNTKGKNIGVRELC